MSKRKSGKIAPYVTRTGIPQIVKGDNGSALLMCPFCNPSHPLQPSVPALCGTILVLTAEQAMFRAKYDRKMVCVKCGKGDGMMVMFQGAFIHTHDCAPGVIAMTQPPEYSKFAKYVYEIKNERLKKLVEGYTGRAVMVEEVTPEAVKTGVIFGYYFNKENKNGKHPKANS